MWWPALQYEQINATQIEIIEASCNANFNPECQLPTLHRCILISQKTYSRESLIYPWSPGKKAPKYDHATYNYWTRMKTTIIELVQNFMTYKSQNTQWEASQCITPKEK